MNTLDLNLFAGFTPGPWTYSGTGNLVGGADRQRVADCWRDNSTPQERQSNAALIAAAPALLAECKRQREEIARLRGALAPIVALLESDGPITAKVWPGLYPLHQAARAALFEVEA